MRMLRTILWLMIGLGSVNIASADFLRINNVRRAMWDWQPGTIEQAAFDIKPEGLFAQCDLNIVVSAQGTSYTATDTLEAQLQFSLPDPGSAAPDLCI